MLREPPPNPSDPPEGGVLGTSPEARVGTVLRGKWTLERLLGVGGMAAVYEGVHRIGRRDAIKMLHPEAAATDDVRRRFEREAETANRFNHPGAVEIRDVDFAEDGSPFLVMELLEGETLAARVRREGISFDELLRFFVELLDVLAAAHELGIIHRDIKPDNLFLARTDTGERLKVLDFGIARVVQSGPRTAVGERLGTVAYMPPEQVKGQEIDHRADLFAVGATLFRILARRRVHESSTEFALIRRMATEAAPRLHDVAPTVPEGLALVVDRSLAFDREDRYPDARTMQADLAAVRRGEPPTWAAAKLAADPRAGETLVDGPAPADLGLEPTELAAPASAGSPDRGLDESTSVSPGQPRGAAARTPRAVPVLSATARPALEEPEEEPPSEPEPPPPTGLAAVVPPPLRYELYIGIPLVAGAMVLVGAWVLRPSPPVARPTALAPLGPSAPHRPAAPPPAASATPSQKPPVATVARSTRTAPSAPPTLMPTASAAPRRDDPSRR